MNTISLQLPDSAHEALRQVANQEQASINHLRDVGVEKKSALMTEDYLEERAARGDRRKFDEAMARVPDVEPDDADRL